ncbi:hypothetical protein M2281_004105 [Mesorhizobium soli]|uniref:SGNH/GDSL hydrolase family protein n=1 Tax=Pseudaminobacter soli (ex Li et al. 2025) TaxID=1295366 RepID=UPI00247396BD|nr:DUF459 domain-containing protein [Mesorhizobium soli]MDH6233494.1 hypothetical protein [Mesorhizobium soli]
MLPRKRFVVPAWVPALLLALAVLATGLTAAVPPAHAQDPYYRPWSFRNFFSPFFQRREPRYYEPPPGEMPGRPKARIKPKMHKAPDGAAGAKQHRVVPAEPPTPVVEKQADAKEVLVIGDFMGSGIAEGLTTVYAANPKVKVVDRSKGSSGFVRDDYYDWPKQVGTLIDTEKPAVVVVMLGSNDRQQMRVGNASEAPRTENWDKEYDSRAKALAKAIADKKVPFIWVGTPAFKFSKMTTDMLAFNDVYRAAAEGAGAEFIDVWDGFVDENGTFVATGPDVDGQPVRLRSDDGINFTKAGKRKLAFYAEKPLNKILGVTNMPGPHSGGPNVPSPVQGPKKAAPIDRTPPISLNDPALDGGGDLLGAQIGPKRGQPDPDTPSDKLLIQGIAPAPSPGRADDFSWPTDAPKVAAPAAPDAGKAAAH